MLSNKIELSIQSKRLAEQLKNIGPKCAEELIRSGINSPEKLKRLGAKEAYRIVLDKGGFCGRPHAAYLYALEGAIRQCHWTSIPESLKQEYKLWTKELREQMGF